MYSACTSCRTDRNNFDIPVCVEAGAALRNWQQERCIILCWNPYRSLRSCGGLLLCVSSDGLFRKTPILESRC
jgi:hypothetical protein